MSVVICLFAILDPHGQEKAGVESSPSSKPSEMRPPALLVKLDQNKPSEAIQITDVDIQVNVIGQAAQFRYTMTFHNSHDRQLEGNLVFPLPRGSTITGYALDIDRRMIDAVPVPRETARYIFESEQRKGIDPGLAEWVKGNNFQTRVWPIPAKGDRKVRVDYIVELSPSNVPNAPTNEMRLVIPMKYADKLGSLNVAVQLPNVARVTIDSGAEGTSEKQFANGYSVNTSRKDVKPTEDLIVRFPVTAQQCQVGKGPDGKRDYFVLNDAPVKRPMPLGNASFAGPIAVYWDASLSRSSSDVKKELAILSRVIQELGSEAIDVIVFRDVVEKPVRFQMSGNDKSKVAADVTAYLQKIPYDGGTNLGAVQIAKTASGNSAVTYRWACLFTDGLSNLGEEIPSGLAMPVQVIASSPNANYPLLREIAQQSAGNFFSISGQQNDNIIERLTHGNFALVKVEFDPTQIEEVYPKACDVVDGKVSIAGRLLVSEATIKLIYAGGVNAGYETKITVKRESVLANDKGGDFVAKQWAQKKIEALLPFAEKRKEELTKLGQEFGIVTPGTSLLVLERLEQYLQYGIEPPKNWNAVHDLWVQQIEQRKVQQKKTKEEKIAQVAKQWNNSVQWWQTNYKYPKDFAYKGGNDAKRDEAGGRPATSPLAPAKSAERTRDSASAPRERNDHSPPMVGDATSRPASAGREGNARGFTDRQLSNSVTNFSASPDGRRTQFFGKERESNDTKAGGSITLQQWDPNTPYLKAMDKAGPDAAYNVYLDFRFKYAHSPAFYLDCADYFFRHQKRDLGARVLTNILDLGLEDARLMRIVAHKLEQEGFVDLAISLFEKIRTMRPEEPQSHRDLALALTARADIVPPMTSIPQIQKQAQDYCRSIELLNEVVLGNWDQRFPEIETISLMEANRNLARVASLPKNASWQNPIDPRLCKLLDMDVRITLTWDTDLTDIDLWVVEPSAETCLYSHNLTTIGGKLTNDFTGGYGPECYLLHQAMRGKYTVKANFYGERQQNLTGGTTIQATMITNFGRPNEQRKSITMRLTKAKDTIDIGAMEFGSSGSH